MPLALLSIPALALQPVAIPAVGTPGTPVTITATAETRASEIEAPHVTRAQRSDASLVTAPRLGLVGSTSMESRRYSRAGRVAGLSWSLGSERLRPRHFERLAGDRLTQHRAVAADAELGLDFASDRLSAVANVILEKRPNGIISSSRNFASTRTLGAGIGWSHAGQWRLDLGFQNTTAHATSPMARLADLVNGSPRAERQVDAQLTLAPFALGPRASATFGLRASTGRLTGYDQSLSGSGNRRDNGVSLVARLAF